MANLQDIVNRSEVGAIKPWTKATAPAGYLLCDGSAVSRSTYAELFAIVSTTYGSGDGSTTFNVPQLQGKMPQGYDGNTYNLAGTGGANTITVAVTNNQAATNATNQAVTVTGSISNTSLTTAQLASHNHNTNATRASGPDGVDNVNEGGTGFPTANIDNSGSGYAIGDTISFDNTGTFGSNAQGFVSIVTGSLVDQNGSKAPANGTEDNILLEDETTSGDAYSGNNIVQEIATTSPAVPGFPGSADTTTGEITKIFISNSGGGYKDTPILSINTSGGTNGNLKAFGNQIGKIDGLRTVEHGKKYETSPAPTLSFLQNLLVTNISGTFNPNTTITSSGSASATIVSIDVSRGILKLKDVSGSFSLNDTITSSTGGTCKFKKINIATASVNVVPVTDTDGAFINEDGKLSESTMKIQDSLYYQDFSYVIKVGQSINAWRDSFKKTMHTSGFYFTGQVNIENRISAQISQPVDGQISGISESPIFGVISQLFSTIFGRRLGTTDDGTTQRTNATHGVDPDFDDSTIEHFTPNTRDITLRRTYTILLSQRSTLYNITSRGASYLRGFAYGGPTMKSLDIYTNPFSASNMYSGTHTKAQTTSIAGSINGSNQYISPLKMVNWADHRVTGFSDTAIDGERFTIAEYNISQMKQPITIPTFITVTAPGTTFDNTTLKFDGTTITFDQT